MSIFTVARHDVDVEHATRQAEALSRSVPKFLDIVPANPEALNSVWSWSRAILAYRCVLDPTASEPATWATLRLAADAGAAIFAGATGSGEVEATVGDRHVRFTAPGPGSKANAGAWLQAIWFAVIDRDDERVARLCAVPEDTLRASGAVHSEFMYPWVESVRTYLLGDPVTPASFPPAMDSAAGTDPDRSTVAPRDAVLLLHYPPITLFSSLFRGLTEKFAEGLEDALTSHREYWTMAPDRTDEPDGFLALAPLAIAVLARKAGMTVDVTSPYLPEPADRHQTTAGALSARKRSSVREPFGAVYVHNRCSGSAGSSNASNVSTNSPTSGWLMRLTPLLRSRTDCRSHSSRNSGLTSRSSQITWCRRG
jgi:hypothetical protein